MGTNSMPAAAPRRRSLSLPSFRRSSASERQEPGLKNVEEAARIQKAAAWQWYTRGVREAAVITPTKPPVGSLEAPATDNCKSCIDVRGPGSKEGKANICNSNMMQKKIVELLPAETHRAAPSRFKAEAGLSSTRPAASGGARPAVPALPAPLGGPSTPLYDELELSSLRIHMADFVQRLQHEHTSENEQSSPAVSDHRSRPPPPSASIDHRQTKAPQPAVPVAASGAHRLTTLPSSSAPVASTILFHKKPLSALQKFFRKVLFGSIPMCTQNSSDIIDSTPALHEPAEVLHSNDDSTTQYHHHHYIHHHHHYHHHFSESPEEQASIIHSQRRHSESGSSRPCTPSLMGVDFNEEEDADEAEESQIAAYFERRRRRRHSESFPIHQLRPENAGFDKDEGMKAEFAKEELPLQFSRRSNSERFSGSRIPTMVGENFAKLVEDVFDEGTFAGIRSRRRHSAQLHRKEPSLERTGGKTEGGAYVLGGAGAGGETPAPMLTGRRRHSESFMVRPEAIAKRTPPPYWKSPSTRYYLDVQERHVGVPAATTAGFNAALPPLYPQ